MDKKLEKKMLQAMMDCKRSVLDIVSMETSFMEDVEIFTDVIANLSAACATHLIATSNLTKDSFYQKIFTVWVNRMEESIEHYLGELTALCGSKSEHIH